MRVCVHLRSQALDAAEHQMQNENALVRFVAYVLVLLLRCFLALVEFLTRFTTVRLALAHTLTLTHSLRARSSDAYGSCYSVSAQLTCYVYTSVCVCVCACVCVSQVRMAITGEAFYDAAHGVVDLMKRNALNAFGVWWLPPFILGVGHGAQSTQTQTDMHTHTAIRMAQPHTHARARVRIAQLLLPVWQSKPAALYSGPWR